MTTDSKKRTPSAGKPAATPAPAPAPAAAPVTDAADLRAQLAAAEAKLAALQVQQMVGALGNASTVAGVSHFVGVRNVSNYTVALPKSPVPNEPSVVLHSDTETPDPRQRAVISYAWWLQLRNTKLLAEGFIVRDDTVLGTGHQAGPADEPADLPAAAEFNVVLDPAKWLAERDEAQLREAIDQITSEATIQRLQYTIDQEVSRITRALPSDTKDPKQRAEAAVAALPGKLRLAESLLENRWIAMTDRYRNV
jgi:hypothetical protein